MARDVVVLVGSLRKASWTRKLAAALGDLGEASLVLEIVEIGELALYNEDLEASVPAPWAAFRDRMRKAEAVLFVTPEYNRSVPGLLKNAIDVGSRPHGKSVFDGKPAGVVSVTPGAAAGSLHFTRRETVRRTRTADTGRHARVSGEIPARLCGVGRDLLLTILYSSMVTPVHGWMPGTVPRD